MILTVSGIRTPVDAAADEAVQLARRRAGLSGNVPGAVSRRSVDARRGRVGLVWSVSFTLREPYTRSLSEGMRLSQPHHIEYTVGRRTTSLRPVVVGFGPAGMLAALTLAEAGYRPVVLERGSSMERRDAAVSAFWREGRLDVECNIQFGEGGAGTYSDGKLNTGVNSPLCREVLRRLVDFGADPDILISAKPHVGTDKLKGIVTSIRERIIALGGEVLFDTRLCGLGRVNGRLCSLHTSRGEIPAERCILAVGHSARDLFRTLYADGIAMEGKLFSMGLRIEHDQKSIDRALYGELAGHPALGAADYKLWDRRGARAVYSFCMCPGGTVVAASSEQGGIVTNGMSLSDRAGKNANAALVAEVLPEDLDRADPLAGLALQERLERGAFAAVGGRYTAPACTLADFMQGRMVTDGPRTVIPSYTAGVSWQPVWPHLLSGAAEHMRSAIRGFAGRIAGYDCGDAVLCGPETRTSSPVRILRDEALFSPSCHGLIPCGEGAGYAGGITSAAADGLRCALSVMAEFAPPKGDRI